MESPKIRLSGVVEESITDGPGIRYSIFTQGCPHLCPGCHNPQTHDKSGGYLKSADDLIAEINANTYLSGVTFTGGEPFLQAEVCHYIAQNIKIGQSIMAFTGYTFEELLKKGQTEKAILDFLQDLDYLVDGRFELANRSLALKFKGSTNQRIIDVKSSLALNSIMIKDF